MTTTARPEQPDSRRSVPSVISEDQRLWLKALLEQSEWWVLRGDWENYMREGESFNSSISNMTRDQCCAALAWLGQQRHALHRAVEGGRLAPDGWLEQQPLFVALQEAVDEHPPSTALGPAWG